MGIFDRGYAAHGREHLWNLLMVNPLVFWVYVKQTFFPWHLKVLYTWPDLQPAYALWQILVSLATVMAAGGTLGLWFFFRRKDLFFYFGAFLALMIPYSNLTYLWASGWLNDTCISPCSVCWRRCVASAVVDVLRRPQPMLRIGVLVAGAAVAGDESVSNFLLPAGLAKR